MKQFYNVLTPQEDFSNGLLSSVNFISAIDQAQALADFIVEFTHDVALEPKVVLPKVETLEE